MEEKKPGVRKPDYYLAKRIWSKSSGVQKRAFSHHLEKAGRKRGRRRGWGKPGELQRFFA